MIGSLFALPKTFLSYLWLFRDQIGNRIFLLIVLNVLVSWAEGIGIALFFPLFASGDGADKLSSTLSAVFRFLHIPTTALGALPFIVIVFLLKGALVFAIFGYQYHLAAQVPRRLREQIIAGLSALDYRAVMGTNTGYFSNLLVNEVARVSAGFGYFVRALTPAFSIAVFFGIVLLLDWQMSLVCCLMGLFAVVAVRLSGRLASHYSTVTTRENSALTSLLIQMVQAFKYLRATAGFGPFRARIGASSDRLAHAESRSGAAYALSQSAAQPVMVLFLAAILYYRAGLRGEEIGSLFVLLVYFFRIMTELWSLQSSWQSFYGTIGSIELVRSVLANAQQNAEVRGSASYSGFKDEIAVRAVSFRYLAEKSVLSDIDLVIKKNSAVAFVGESGSGKSTLVDLITGTLKPTSGSITVDGKPLEDFDLETMRRRIGYVPQDSMLFDDTITNNIALWDKDPDEARVREAARRAECLEFIEAMPEKFASPIGDRGIKLSGGQRQRLAIARELFKQPEILVLDEATSALDSESERAIQRSIDSLKGQMTILIIAHRLSTVRNCDRIAVLHQGRVVEQGGYEELRARPGSRFRAMCELQMLSPDEAAVPA